VIEGEARTGPAPVVTQALSPPRTGSEAAGGRQETGKGGYRPALDGVRALAVASVVGYHFGFHALPGGFLGVDVFFVLSGYLITSLLLQEHAARGSISLSGFYVRRLRRLFPALALVVLAVLVRTALFASPLQLQDRFHDMVAALLYYANWHYIASDQSYFAGLSGASPLRHTWSLAIEEQFYLVWPVLLLGLLRLGALRRRGLLLAGTTALVGLSAWSMAQAFDPDAPSRAYYGSDGRAQQLLVGVLLAVVLLAPRARAASHRTWAVASLLGLAAVAVSLNRYHDQASFYYQGGALLAAVLAAVLIAGVERAPSGPVARLLSLGPVAWLGRISYGVYLWHWPVLVWVHASPDAGATTRRGVTVLRIALTLVVATASYYLVERPVRQGNVPGIRRSAVRTVVAFAVCQVLLCTTAYATTRPVVVQRLTQTAAPVGVVAQAADGSVTACPRDPRPCLRVKGPAGSPVVATVGDSTMQAYDKGLRLLAREHGFGYVQGAVGGCPIGHRLLATGKDGHRFKKSNHVCFDRMPGIYRDLVVRRHVGVFLATSSNEQSPSVGPDGTVLVPGTAAHLAATEAALEDSVRYLTSRGAWVVLVHALPRGPGVACLDHGTLSAPRCNVPVAHDALTPRYNQVLDRVAARHHDRVRVVDLSDVVCPGGVCSLVVHGVVMRYDGGHFTRRASEYVAPYLYARVRASGVPLP
jgi:peptidoglycan/LPS O-acetylase OafA/YrhL